MGNEPNRSEPLQALPDGEPDGRAIAGAPDSSGWNSAAAALRLLSASPPPLTVAALDAQYAIDATTQIIPRQQSTQIRRVAPSSWELLDTLAELRPHIDAGRTFGFAAPAGVATTSGATWISPLLVHSVEFPSVWIKGPREARYMASRARLRKLLDRLCGLDASTPPPRTVVVVAHPDDEAIGAGARLRALPDSVIVHVTDGAPRDPAYALRKGFPSREAYARSRQDELSAVLAVLGIPRERTRCLDIVDGEAADHLVEITYRLADLLDELRPDIVVTHPYEGGHTDHDATTFAVHLACGVLRREGAPAPIVLELTSYHWYQGQRRLGEFLPFREVEERTVELEAHTQSLKQEMYECFASQHQCLAVFPRDREKFRVAPRYVFTSPPHPGQLLYERVSETFNGAEWRESARRALERLRSKKR